MKHFREKDKMVLEFGENNVSEELLTGENGNILNIITKKSRYVDEKGRKFVVGLIRDNSERKKMEDAFNVIATDKEDI